MTSLTRPQDALRLGLVGGGLESGIGATHRFAARLDGHYELVAGVFSSNAQHNRESASAFGIAYERCYSHFIEMAKREAARPDGIEVAAIMAPNALHVPASSAFIKRGIDVICDKPLASELRDALELQSLVRRHRCVFALTHNYSGYPMLREARDRIRAGDIGELRMVQVEHAGAFGVDAIEQQGVRRMAWRTDASVVGESAVLADVGVHAHHLLRFVTGLEVEQVAADLHTLTPQRTSDDNAHVLLRLRQGVRGMLWASFVAAGHRHGLQLRVFGSKGSMAWHQEEPERLVIRPQRGPHVTLRRSEPWLGAAAQAAGRTKAGMPEGFIEAFANIYSDAAEVIRARRAGRDPQPLAQLCPTVEDGVAGLQFIKACVRSNRTQGAWTRVLN
jgi:predicted dehydrogenase